MVLVHPIPELIISTLPPWAYLAWPLVERPRPVTLGSVGRRNARTSWRCGDASAAPEQSTPVDDSSYFMIFMLFNHPLWEIE